MLSTEEKTRYLRHFSLSEIGVHGQEILKQSRVLCIGAGGLGSPALLYLTASGVGHIGVVDDDVVELSNLQRQVLFASDDVGKKKCHVATAYLSKLNANVQFEAYDQKINIENVLSIIDQYDVVIDGTDNFQTRYLINDACCQSSKPNVHASVLQFEGLCTVFTSSKQSPCYRCLFPEPPKDDLVPNCAEGGVLGVLPGILGSLQAVETLKYILEIGDLLDGRIMRYDALSAHFSVLNFSRKADCIACGDHKQSFHELPRYAKTCQGNSPQVVSSKRLHTLMLAQDPMLLLDVREEYERDISYIAGSLHIPLQQLKTRYGELDPEKPIIVYCRLGARSAKAVKQLAELGISEVFSLEGGMQAWEDQVNINVVRT